MAIVTSLPAIRRTTARKMRTRKSARSCGQMYGHRCWNVRANVASPRAALSGSGRGDEREGSGGAICFMRWGGRRESRDSYIGRLHKSASFARRRGDSVRWHSENLGGREGVGGAERAGGHVVSR